MTAVEAPRATNDPWRVTAESAGRSETFEADHLWSTLPISLLARSLKSGVPSEVLAAAGDISYRSMVLIYLQLPVARFTEYDAHYFPSSTTRITRLSEPKNYSALGRPEGTTVLCAELPCAVGDRYWSASDDELARIVARDVETAEIPLPAKPIAAFTRRLPQAYPIYGKGYERALEPLDRWVGEQEGLLSYGRQGLFAHDNTHHALAMAYAAVECLEVGRFDVERWRAHRAVFATHVVED